MPRSMVIEGANLPDFSDSVVLTEYRMESAFDAGPIIARRFPETLCRYVRLVVNDPYVHSGSGGIGSRVGFAEIELFGPRGHPVTLLHFSGPNRIGSSPYGQMFTLPNKGTVLK